MKKGPHWSDEGVQALLTALRGRLENVDCMTDDKLNQECAKRVALEGLVGKSQAIKAEALKDWHWNNAIRGVLGEIEKTVKKVETFDVDKEVSRVVELLKKNGSLAEGGVKSLLFRDSREKISGQVIERGLNLGLIKREKTTTGSDVLAAV